MATPLSPPAPSLCTVDAFLRTVLGSGLLAQQEVQASLQPLTPEQMRDPQLVADHLVKIGKLSRFQAGKLLQGISLGLVLGPFHLLAPIGRGGMGAVYLARDSRNQGLVAVKVLPPKKAKAEERLLARFRREMELCQRVCHPYLTQTLEVGTQGDVHFIVMEFIRGKNMARLVNEEGAVPVPRVARLFSEVAVGLEHAHSQGLIHRDLKPSNIMVQTDDHAKVLDLGLALIQGEVGDRTVVGGAGYLVGTLDYIAPEQSEDATQVDARSDIYSLGCTLYYALTQQPPFPGGTAIQKLLRHRCDEPPAIEQFNGMVPTEFAALVRRMMAKRQQDRFANAAEVRTALAPWCDRPVVPPPVPLADRKPAPVVTDTGPLPVADVAEPGPIIPAWLPQPAPAPPKPAPQAPAAEPPPPIVAKKPAAEEPRKKPSSGRQALVKSDPFQAARDLAAVPVPVPVEMQVPPVPVAVVVPVPLPDPVKKPIAEEPRKKPASNGPQPPVKAELPRDIPVPVAVAAPPPLVTVAPSAPAPVAVFDPAVKEMPVPVEFPPRPGELPFWLDFLVPVGSCALFLFLVWLIAVTLLLRH